MKGRGKRKGFRFQILSISARVVLADLEPEKRGKVKISFLFPPFSFLLGAI